MTGSSSAYDGETPTGYKWLAFCTVAIGQYCTVIAMSGVSVALPRIARDLELTLTVVSWVTVATALTISSVLLAMGRLSDIVGRKRVYLAGMWTLAVGAAISANAPALPALVASRVIEGVGAAMIMTVAMAIVTSVFPARERGKALGMNMAVIGLGAVSGPAAGGALIDLFNWRAVFIAISALALAGSFAGLFVLKESRISPGGRGPDGGLDWPGIAMSSSGLALFILSLTSGARLGWDSPFIAAGMLLFVALFAAFLWWERRAPSPMIDLGMFRNMQFTWAVATRFQGFLAQGSVNFLMPFYLQEVTSRSPSQAGLITMPLPLTMALVGPISGRLSDRLGFRKFMVAGLIVQVGSLLVFSTFRADTPLWVILPALVAHGFGSGLWMAPGMSAAYGAVGRSAYGVAAAFLNLVRNTANVTSIAAAATVVAAVMLSRGITGDLDVVGNDPTGPPGDAFLAGMRVMFILLAVVVGSAIFSAVMAGRQSAKERSREPEAPLEAAQASEETR